MERLLQPKYFAGFVIALICFSYPEVVFGAGSFVLRDYGIFGYPLAAHHRQAFWSGEIPLWNPNSCSGMPFLAQWNTMVLYPGSLIYLLLPLPWSLGLFMFAHQFLGAMGMHFVARRWTGNDFAAACAGIVWGFNGLMLNSLMWPNNIAALGWMPWVIYAAARACEQVPTHRECGRRIAIAALAGGCQMMAGAPEVIAFTWVIAFVAAVARWERGTISPLFALGKFATVVVLVALLCAAQLWPFFELLKLSQRSADFGGGDWSLPWHGLANFLVPLFRTYRSPQGPCFHNGQEWTTSYYFGVIPLLLAPLWFRKENRWWVALALGAFVLALGPAGKVWGLIKSLGFIRFPIKFIVPVVFAGAVLTAFSMARFEVRKIWSGLLALMIVGIAAVSLAKPIEYEEPRTVAMNALVRLVFLGGFIYCAWKGATWSKPVMVCLLAADLLTHMPRQNTVAKASAYEAGMSREAVKNERAFQTKGAHDRFYFEMRPDPTADYTGRRMGLYGNCNLIDGIQTVDGFYSLYLSWERDVWQRLFFAPTNAFPTGLAKFLGIRAMNFAENPVEWKMPDFEALPKRTSGQRVEILAHTNILQRIASPAFDPAAVVYVSDESFPKGSAVAVISEAWHPNWRAKVNGADAKVFRANGAFMAVPLPAAEASLEMRYEDRAFYFGSIISLGALALTLGMWAWGRRLRDRSV